MSLNPALDEARFCPRCGAAATVDFPRSIACETCGYQAFFNPKPVAAAIPFDADGRIWLHRRGFEPGKGLWTFVGGFVDLGESVQEAAKREAREEMELDLELGPVVGVYSRPEDRVVLIVYSATIRDGSTPRTTDEAPVIEGFAPGDLPWAEMAFWSTTQALQDVLTI